MADLVSTEAPQRRLAFRASIGTKFLALISVMLVVALCAVIINATRMFRLDNLDTISLSSDLLTAAKAGQIQIWAESVVNRGMFVAEGLASNPGAKNQRSLDALLQDPEILFVKLDSGEGGTGAAIAHYAYNEPLLKSLGMDRTAEPAAERLQGGTSADLWSHPSGRSVILFRTRTDRGVATVAVYNQLLASMFADTGPYVFALINANGQILVHKDPKRVKSGENLGAMPLVKKAMASKMDRLLEEFTYEGERYLGSFAKIRVADLGVLNLVPRSTALETGNTLVRRSLVIGALIFVLALFGSNLITQSIVAPVGVLTAAARHISKGNFGDRVEVESRDEVSDLARSFNLMSYEISRRIEVLAKINQIALQARATSEPQALLNLAVESLIDTFGYQAGIGFFKETDGDGKTTKFMARKNWTDPQVLQNVQSALPRGINAKRMSLGGSDFLACPIVNKGHVRGFMILLAGPTDAKGARPNQYEEETRLVEMVVSIFATELESSSFSRELKVINAELEQRVQIRTAELASTNSQLSEAKKEIDDVMDNIQQGILTFGSDGRINQEFSRYTLDIFGNLSPAGKDITELVLPEDSGETRQEDLKDWLRTVFEQPENWGMLQDFGIRELKFLSTSEDGSLFHKDLKFEWRPIYENETIAKLMLICADITEQKRLEAEISKKEAEHSEQLEIIAQLINHPKSVVEQFVSDFSRNLESALQVLGAGEEALDGESMAQLMRSLHTIKGCAKQFRLNSVQERAGAMETQVSAAIENPPTDAAKTTFFTQISEEFGFLNASLKQMLAFYNKVVNGGGSTDPATLRPSVAVPLDRVERLIARLLTGPKMVPTKAVRKAVGFLIKSPVKSLFDRLEELMRTLAPELGREVQLVREGDLVAVDFRVLNLLHDALLHVVRNSLDHGGETPAQREARGKPGTMTLSFFAESLADGRVRVVIQDDGKGVAVEIVRQRAVEKGLIGTEEAMSMPAEEVIQLIFLAGFSTKETVSDISGRGVGMEVVKNIVEKDLRGELKFSSVEGEGTRLEIVFAGDVLVEAAAQGAQAQA